jgi:hypothetical protein
MTLGVGRIRQGGEIILPWAFFVGFSGWPGDMFATLFSTLSNTGLSAVAPASFLR